MKRIKQKLSEVLDFSKSSQITLVLFIEIVLGVLFTLAMLAVFFKLGEDVIDKEVIFFDEAIMHFIYSFHSPFLTSIMEKVTFLGGEIFLGGATLITILLLFRKHKKDAVIFAFILVFGVGLNLLLKHMFQRPRPDLMPLIHEITYSFPSGHAMNSFVFYISLSYFIFRNTANKKLGLMLSGLSAIIIFLIGLSRIYLGVHYPSDVLAGYVAGFGWFVIALVFEKTLIFLRLFRKYEVDKKY